MELIPSTSHKLQTKEIQCLITVALLELYFNDDEQIISKFVEYCNKELKTSIDDIKFKNIAIFNNFKNKLMITKSNSAKNNITTLQLQNYNNDEIIQHIQEIRNSTMYQLNYIEVSILGSGGYGSVFKAFHKLEKKFYAIKKISLFDENDILNEVQIMTALKHPNIVKYYSSWIDANNNYTEQLLLMNGDEESSSNSSSNTNNYSPLILYIQMELCDTTLKEWLVYDSTIDEKIELYKQLVFGIHYLHENNVIHRDLKPDNIFINNLQLKIGDLGLSKKIEGNVSYNYHSMDANKIIYQAPEINEDDKCGFCSDIYSIGIILIEMLLIQTKTIFEKRKMIMTIKKEEKVIDGYLQTNKYNELIESMIKKNVIERVTINDIICNTTLNNS